MNQHQGMESYEPWWIGVCFVCSFVQNYAKGNQVYDPNQYFSNSWHAFATPPSLYDGMSATTTSTPYASSCPSPDMLGMDSWHDFESMTTNLQTQAQTQASSDDQWRRSVSEPSSPHRSHAAAETQSTTAAHFGKFGGPPQTEKETPSSKRLLRRAQNRAA